MLVFLSFFGISVASLVLFLRSSLAFLFLFCWLAAGCVLVYLSVAVALTFFFRSPLLLFAALLTFCFVFLLPSLRFFALLAVGCLSFYALAEELLRIAIRLSKKGGKARPWL